MRVEREAAVGGFREGPLQYVARVRRRRLAVGGHDVAEHAGGRVHLAAPREDLEGRRVRVGEHVSLERPSQSLDRRAVEANALAEGALDLGRRIATDFKVPTTSVNHSRTNLTPRSSIVRRTKSRCLSMQASSWLPATGAPCASALGYRYAPTAIGTGSDQPNRRRFLGQRDTDRQRRSARIGGRL